MALKPPFFIRLFLFILLIQFSFFSVPSELPKRIDEVVWSQTKSLSGIPSDGLHGPAQMYVFFDPNCLYCAHLWKLLNGRFKQISPRLIWIPVSYMSDSSFNMAASLLRQPDPKNLLLNFEHFNFTQRKGKIIGIASNTKEKDSLGKSKAVWEKLGEGTPLMVWRARSTGAVVSYVGLPSELQLEKFLQDVASETLEQYKKK